VWKHGELDPKGSLSILWDQMSVNTCPDNFIWKAGQQSIIIEAEGLYEICGSFVSKKKRCLVQVYLDENPVISVSAKEGGGHNKEN